MEKVKKGDFNKQSCSAIIGAGVIGAGMLAKKVLSGKKKKEVKEQTTFQMQQRINDVKERRREQQKNRETYIDTKKKVSNSTINLVGN